jgi:hypothetical protein
MDDYRLALGSHYPHLHSIAILVPSFGLTFHPWSSWPDEKNPEWWSLHQSVKHDRGKNFFLGTAERCFTAASALFALLAYRYHLELGLKLELPKLFALKRQYDVVVSGGCELPDFDSNGNRIP